MNRRELLASTLALASVTTRVSSAPAVDQSADLTTRSREASEIYVHPVSGADSNLGSRGMPLRTLAEAARRASRSDGAGAMTIVLAEGVHVINETAILQPQRRAFSRVERLTIRAEILPDDASWHIGRMPTLVHALPLSQTWNGRVDPLGGAADGMLIGTSHVSILGLRILGLAVIESPQAGVIRRLYAISRLDRELDDLQISQCVFAGEETTTPLHVGIIANGNGVAVHNCVFRGLKISAVFWTPGSSGHSMHHCVCDGLYGSAVWTAGVAPDFSYRNNVVVNSNYVWTSQGGASALADAATSGPGAAPSSTDEHVRYRVVDSVFAGNRRLTGSGTGARLEYRDIDPSLLELVRTSVLDKAIPLERDSTKRNYLQPQSDSKASRLKAGLFTKAPA